MSHLPLWLSSPPTRVLSTTVVVDPLEEAEDTYIAPLQAQLSDLEEDRSNLMYENKKYDDNYDDYFHRRNQIEQDIKLINSTSYDEALHYMDMENLNALLKQ